MRINLIIGSSLFLCAIAAGPSIAGEPTVGELTVTLSEPEIMMLQRLWQTEGGAAQAKKDAEAAASPALEKLKAAFAKK